MSVCVFERKSVCVCVCVCVRYTEKKKDSESGKERVCARVNIRIFNDGIIFKEVG